MIASGVMPSFHRRLLLRAAVTALSAPSLLAAARTPAPSGYALRPDVQEFIGAMAREEGFSEKKLLRLFSNVETQNSAIRAMTAPVSAPPKWFEYAPQFVNSERIARGV